MCKEQGIRTKSLEDAKDRKADWHLWAGFLIPSIYYASIF